MVKKENLSSVSNNNKKNIKKTENFLQKN